MIAFIIAVVVASLVCLAFDSSRLIGVLGVLLLVYLHPLLFAVLFVLAVAVACFINPNLRSIYYEFPRLTSRRD